MITKGPLWIIYCSYIALSMILSKIMTIMIYFHQMRFRDFKSFYTQYLKQHLKKEFPQLLSYNRFIELMPSILILMCAFIQAQSKTQTGIYFVDATTIDICHVKRVASNRVFKGIAKKGKSSMGWFFGFKLHLVINDKGEIMAFKLTQATTDDREPVPSLTENLVGKLVGDRGYISQKLFDPLFEKGLQLITKIKKNISQIEHSRHRSINNFMVNLLSGIAAYTLQPKKPSLILCSKQLIAC